MKKLTISAVVALACLGSAAHTLANDPSAQKPSSAKLDGRLSGIAAHSASLKSKTAPAAGVHSKDLPVGGGSHPRLSAAPLNLIDGDKVAVDIIANGDPQALLAELQALGMTHGAVFGNMVGGVMPISRLGDLEGLSGVTSVSPVMAQPQAGLVTSRGDTAMNSDVVKSLFGIDGAGVTVGTLSDSFDCTGQAGGAAADVANDDLPAGIQVLEDLPSGCIDEGRAMMQIIHDVAPGSSQAFHTAFLSTADFANGIIELQDAGADVIVDDIIYYAEPMFADGIIAQAAQQVADNGSAYFSSAGNNGSDSYEGSFEDSGELGIFGGIRHDFDPGPDVDTLQSFALTPGLNTIVFQWDQPYASTSADSPGSASDVDIIPYLTDGTPLFFLVNTGGINFNIGGDPVEVFQVVLGGTTPLEVEIGLELFDGPAPGFIKYVHFAGAQLEHVVESGTSYGHANAKNVAGVGASAWFNTSTFNPGVCEPACLNGFSSWGGVPILYKPNGDPTFRLRPQPRFVAPDGTNTTFFSADLSFPVPGTTEPDGFPNFFGTSAAAPHAAAVAALMLETNPRLSPREIYAILQLTADDMRDGPGENRWFDFASGWGFIDAEAAVDRAATPLFRPWKRYICHKYGKNKSKQKTKTVPKWRVSHFLDKGDKFGRCD